MNTLIDNLKKKIDSGNFPNEFPHFGGAGLIITDDSKRKTTGDALVIVTEHASAMSWLVVELKEIYSSDMDYLNKYDFYPVIGNLIKESLTSQDKVFDSMLFVVEEIMKMWGKK